MLVQKQLSPSRRNTLVILLVVVLLAGGWVLWTNVLQTAPETTGSTLDDLAATRVAKIPEVDTGTLTDDRLIGQDFSTPTTFTEQQEVTARVAGIPITPQAIEVNNISIGRTLVALWQIPAGEVVDGVRIYRSVTSDGELTLLAELSATTRAFEDHTVVDGQPYWYLIKSIARDEAGTVVESANLDRVTATSTDTLPPDPPTQVSVENTGDGTSARLSWVVPPQDDFSHIRIYRSDTRGLLGGVIDDGTVQGTAYTDTGLVTGTTYYYTIVSVDESGNESNGLLYQTAGRDNPFEPTF